MKRKSLTFTTFLLWTHLSFSYGNDRVWYTLVGVLDFEIKKEPIKLIYYKSKYHDNHTVYRYDGAATTF